ncbi:FAD-binding molybdopterin dehydrogenase [Rhodococcus triatomae]|uniref:CO or xanthine dehydrogenase, FAD-binding subunit n=1 Tax=Rhodococcus triatomae TaxID=300028 RepID=A0A1G8BEL5_9NOCA|nr:FAD binding domain-containing protein [Rhodococcus triatomae]QNG17421.1 FAD-binding molybdopterin dehydrogenase [Rhodococcus triatomae]QNG22911.1 FAD-binding molybdopterin dehydrogenase [Rhodococcus triatomae]SDH31551.1 CO or xanthine dehydrogenase, FAD-binding subunit [Rhodococcus triatomae]
MDLSFVTEVASPRRREDLPPPRPGTAFLAGGTWVYSEPQPAVDRLVDLTALDWPAVTTSESGLTISATCTIETLCAVRLPENWSGARAFRSCADALLASWKIWHTATVGGNLALSLPAGAMIAACCALDATLTIWTPDGSEYHLPAEAFVTGVGTNVLRPGEILRSITIGSAALCGRVAVRKVAYAPLGRSGALLVARHGTDGSWTLVVTAGTVRPHLLRFPEPPTASELSETLAATVAPTDYLTDAHGTASWRRHVTALLAEEIREELT